MDRETFVSCFAALALAYLIYDVALRYTTDLMAAVILVLVAVILILLLSGAGRGLSMQPKRRRRR